MREIGTCLRCGSNNLNQCMVNTTINLNYSEKKNIVGLVTQRVINPTDAIICRECGHIEFFFDWDKTEKD